MRNLLLCFFAISLIIAGCTNDRTEDGDAMIVHTSQIPSVSEIQEHVLVAGDSYRGLWLGPGILFTPGHDPEDFHIFFVETDLRGGDSMQEHHYFKVPGLPRNRNHLSEWHTQWESAPYPEALRERTDEEGYRYVPSYFWKYHKMSGKNISFGHLLRHDGDKLSNHVEYTEITYSIYDPATGKFTDWDSFRVNVDGSDLPCVGYGQRVDLPNGDILLPFSTVKELKGYDSFRWCGSARLRLEGDKIVVLEVGNLFTNPVPRGFVEPSMAEYEGKYFMTLRAQDGHSHVTTSPDGLYWEDPKPWIWDNGEAIAMDQTMTKFISRPEGLFLVYTRITEDNQDVFRHRAPLFIAQIDPDRNSLIRETESKIFANNGFPLGNFGVYEVSPKETWVTSQEWDRTGEEKDCDILLGRIVWE